MKIAIIGASRGIGYELLKLSLEQGHEVSALLRNPTNFDVSNEKLNIVKGDIRNLDSVKTVIKDQDVICICIGISPTNKPVDIFSVGVQNVLSAMGENSSQKLISVTGIGAGDSKGHGGFLYDKILNPLLLKSIYKDKDKQEEIIKASNVEWLIVRPGFLTNGERTGKYRVIDDLSGITAGKISRLDVADFILKQLKNTSNFGKTPLLMY